MKIFSKKIKVIPFSKLEISGFSSPFDFYGKKSEKFVMEGTWSLTEECDLAFRVLASDRPGLSGETVIFRGQIADVKGDFLRFRIRDSENPLGVRSGNITLSGRWMTDKRNGISFRVSKTESDYDVLTFGLGWKIDRNNELVYEYRKTLLKKEVREEKIIAFKGSWQILNGCIKYKLQHSSLSDLSFDAKFASKTLSVRDRRIRFVVGVMVEQAGLRRYSETIVSIYGAWTLDGKMRVSFMASYSGGRREKIEFGVKKLMGNAGSLALYLTDSEGEGLGVKVEFTKVFRNDAEFFLALSKTGAESKILGGLMVRF